MTHVYRPGPLEKAGLNRAQTSGKTTADVSGDHMRPQKNTKSRNTRGFVQGSGCGTDGLQLPESDPGLLSRVGPFPDLSARVRTWFPKPYVLIRARILRVNTFEIGATLRQPADRIDCLTLDLDGTTPSKRPIRGLSHLIYFETTVYLSTLASCTNFTGPASMLHILQSKL